MRLIDADKLERDLESLKQDYEDEGCDGKRIDGIDDCIEEIRCTEPIDAAPVVHTHWIKSNYDNVDGTIYKCSNCNTEMFSAWNYCPHCGAKMDKEVEKQKAQNERVNCETTKCDNCVNHHYCDYER